MSTEYAVGLRGVGTPGGKGGVFVKRHRVLRALDQIYSHKHQEIPDRYVGNQRRAH